jgi:lipoyl(octanoyl) transferase
MEWLSSHNPVDYPEAVARMEERVASIRAGTEAEVIWLVEHPPLYTAGTSAKAEDLKEARFPVYDTGRGGQYTYHGPGQRVAYVMLDLKKRDNDIRRYVFDLEEWLIQTLQILGVSGRRIAGRVGIWVGDDISATKIAAIGVRVRHGVTYHGVALNVNPDLSHFNGIVPCGIADAGVTSLQALDIQANFAQVDAALKKAWQQVFSKKN